MELIFSDELRKNIIHFNTNENNIRGMVERNINSIEWEESEEILLMGNPAISFYIQENKVWITNIINQNQIF